jgi:hypothetical protein
VGDLVMKFLIGSNSVILFNFEFNNIFYYRIKNYTLKNLSTLIWYLFLINESFLESSVVAEGNRSSLVQTNRRVSRSL